MRNLTNGPDTVSPLRVAVCFLSFDRCHLVRLTLERVLRFMPSDWVLRVWQDGHRERHSGRIVGNRQRIMRNLDFFERLGLDVDHEPETNRGTAFIYWEAETWAFETVKADFCIFIEDDIVISAHFFTMMKQLAKIALNDGRVGAFSAFGDASVNWPTQWRSRHKLQPMHHRWGYGITRQYWLRTRPDYQNYLRLFETTDYRARSNIAAGEWFSGLDHAEPISHITSQDGARTAIMLKLGCFSIMTAPSYAVNIGKRGMHSYPSFYIENRANIRGPHAFFPWPTRLPQKLTPAAAARLESDSRSLAYW